jgi:hypothetical protein
MSKSKLTLLIDGNWLFMSRLSVLMNKCIDDLELIQEVKILIIKSIKIVLHKFPNIDNIIFCADGGSWRNNIELPQSTACDLLNELNDENEVLKQQLKTKYIVNKQYEELQKVKEENEELKSENQHIKDTIAEAYQNERTSLGKSVLKQLIKQME